MLNVIIMGFYLKKRRKTALEVNRASNSELFLFFND
ncbi:hypothetical protein SVI_0786 [Shewanella violacea DSS12]|uniref:Uncharacterized protein n=1 Tax=Shewanella violacea (strain JCM 10179 / CIP 106290 / LMG 19151 / DSS12) TaxID=637905 RepID=D4ZGF8_SHEVD|nr:hypothetical protein SVI_0786 [Shewanella violacea DSS12]